MQKSLYNLLPKLFLTFLFIGLPNQGQANPDKIKTLTLQTLPYSPKLIKKISEGSIYAHSKVKTLKEKNIKKQELKFSVTGLHEKSCRFALRKLSQYEVYKNHIGFIKESRYLEKRGRVDFLLSSMLLPYDMRLNFKIPRITTVGTYPFFFDQGFLKNLRGFIRVSKSNKRCLFHTTAHWKGPHSGISNSIFEFFSSVLSELAMKNLFRISRTY